MGCQKGKKRGKKGDEEDELRAEGGTGREGNEEGWLRLDGAWSISEPRILPGFLVRLPRANLWTIDVLLLVLVIEKLSIRLGN